MKPQTSSNQISIPVAVAFYRVSTDNQNNNRQISDIRRYCKGFGFNLVKEFEETISGASRLQQRTELKALLAYVDEFKPQFVVVSELSRLARSQDALIIIRSWTEKGVCFISLKENIKTLNAQGQIDPMTNLLLGILNAVNVFELDTIKYRVKSGLNRTVNSGTWTGKAPYGYDVSGKKNLARLVTNDESLVVQDMFKWYSENWGTHRIASYLNSNVILTKENVQWVDSKVYKILNNTIYIGKRQWNKELLPMPEARIIDDGLFQIVAERLKSNANTTEINKHNKFEYLLQGKIKCSCGRGFVGQHRHNLYMCASKKYKGGCKTKSIKIDYLETEIKRMLIENEAKLVHDNTLLLSKVGELEQELVTYESDLQLEKRTQNNLLNNIAVIPQTTFQLKYTASQKLQVKLQTKIEDLQKKLTLSRQNTIPDGLIDWGEIHIQKEILQKIIEKIDINNDSVNVTLSNNNSFVIER